MSFRIPALLLAAAIGATACGPSSATSTGSSQSTPVASDSAAAGMAPAADDGTPVERVATAADVSINATWAGPAAGPVFDVVLDTHAGSLDDIDLGAAVLRDDRGDEVSATGWDAEAGGHHRTGKLRFPADADALLRNAAWIELVLPAIRDATPDPLRWTVPG